MQSISLESCLAGTERGEGGPEKSGLSFYVQDGCWSSLEAPLPLRCTVLAEQMSLSLVNRS